jgi:5-methylcytosine-specific restriction endonuclease McrA
MKTCTKDNCDRAQRARGLCSSHYNQEHQPNRHAKKMVACAFCGTEVLKHSGGGRKYGQVCSDRCRQWLATPYCILPADHWARWYGKCSEWIAPTSKPRFTSRQCADCPSYFIYENLPKYNSPPLYCSKQCGKRVSERNRRAKGYGVIGEYTRKSFYALVQAVGGLCSYCDLTIDGPADADHVTPISRGGRNDLSNLTPACRACNGDKSDMTLSEWADSRAERGLGQRRYTLDTCLPRFMHLTLTQATGEPYRFTLAA